MPDIIQFNCRDHWQEIEIILERINNNDELLGFTIAGGIDRPYMSHDFTSIIVTCITENGLAHKDKRLQLYDLILRVNNIDFSNVKHEKAVDALGGAGRKVELLIRRLSPLINEEIVLNHNGKLGISITGGIGNQYFRKDPGIFITDVENHQTNEQIYIGDRLLKISSMHNTYDLRFVTYEMAREYIQLACAENGKIKLCVARSRSIERVQYEKQHDSLGFKDEGSVSINANDYSTEDPHHQAHDVTISAVLNEQLVDNEREEEENQIMSFDFDDYQRSSPVPTVKEYKPNPPKNSNVERHKNTNDCHRNSATQMKANQQLQQKEVAIRKLFI